jgi:fibronectin type 3 domain-containing protein
MDLLRYSDQIPGFRYPSTAYNDGGHQSNTSNYMFAAMEYAWIFCESPLGLPARAEQRSRRRTGPLFDLTEQQALALQRIGYYHLTHHSTSGVDLPDDDAAPATPGKIEVDATPEAVTLSWPEVKEEGTGTHKYVIRRSDGAEFDNVLARYVDRSVQSGESYTYRVVAVDFAGNESGASEPVSVDVPVDREAPEIAEVIADSTAQTVRVVFSEPVDAEAARQESRFSVNGVNALDARLAAPHIVVLTTTEMEDGEQYTLTVRNMPDRAAAPNTADALAAAFTFKPPRWTTFDLDEWDGTEVELEGPQLRITAKGEGGFQSRLTFDKPAMAGIYREVEGDFDVPLAITSQGQVAATLELKPYQRKGNVKTGFVLAEDIENIGQGYFAVFYLDDSTRFRMTVHRKWIITGRHIGAGLSQGDPRKNRQGLDLPVWLRFVREGKLLTAYYSKTGVGEDDWTKLGSIKADRMPDKVQLGIFNMSGVADEHSTAMFDLRATGKEQSYTNVGE